MSWSSGGLPAPRCATEKSSCRLRPARSTARICSSGGDCTRLRPGASPILGLDFAGFLVSVSPDVQRWHVGDRVFGIVPGGGYARYLTIPANQLLPIPPNLSFVEAAAAAEVFIAAHVSLFVEGGLMPAESVLIHGGGSGVGTAAIQLVNARGAVPLVTAGTDEKVGRCLELGARLAVNHRSRDFEDAVMRFTGGAGVDVVLDWIGAPYLARHLALLREKGRLVVIGLMGGSKAEIRLDLVVTRRLRVIGSVLRSRSDRERAGIIRAFEHEVLPWLRDGVVKPIVHAIFSVAEVEQAHELLRESSHFGKVVLVWDSVRS